MSLLILFLVPLFWGCSSKPSDRGTLLIVALDTNNASTPGHSSELLARTEEVLRKRFQSLGIRPSIEHDPQGRLWIRLPERNGNDLVAARRMISAGGVLELRLVHPQSREYIERELRGEGHEVLHETREIEGQEVVVRHLVENKPANGITGLYIENARVYEDPIRGAPDIHFSLNPEGARLFAELTQANVGRQLAILLNGEVYSAPLITGPITGGQVSITGQFTHEDASDLATLLANPLEVPLRIIEEQAY
ncbi:MAG TPA: hypothetical protein VMS21_05805 [Methylomirabilota bacterium]|nr:hypothetical protein [Methylomirabilota bacterium]